MSNLSTVSATAVDGIFDSNLLPTRIQIFLSYDQQLMSLQIGVKQLECSLDPVYENEQVYWQVHMTVLLYHNRETRKTKYKPSSNPVFNQVFEVKGIGTSMLRTTSVRYQVYGRLGQTGQKRFAGETLVAMENVANQQRGTVSGWKTLRNSRNVFVGRNRTDSI